MHRSALNLFHSCAHFFTHSWSYLYHGIPSSLRAGLSKTKKFLVFSLQYPMRSLRVNVKLHLLKKLRFSSIFIFIQSSLETYVRKKIILVVLYLEMRIFAIPAMNWGRGKIENTIILFSFSKNVHTEMKFEKIPFFNEIIIMGTEQL